ncbi:MAG: acyltransferase family protein [Pseudomonadota bacterium]|nr:acyltransferase family protein [Pseudomonadota bacterium]
MRARKPQRLPLIDFLKVVASQLIVLHHLALYGPMADHVAPLMPALMGWLADPARMVVQVFLVVGGYLAALGLAPNGQLREPTRVGSRLVERYLRLALPLVLALLLAIAAASVARGWMDHPSVPEPPRVMQVVWHLLLAQDLVGEEALSAGIWYVSIDLQLYAALLLWLALVSASAKGRDAARRALPWGVVGAVAWSALYVNRDTHWDISAPYFFAANGLGVLVAWARSSRAARLAFGVAVASVLLGLWLEWRDRLALATVLALVLWQAQSTRSGRAALPGSLGARVLDPLHHLGRISYAVFLLHFPVCLVVNAAFTAFVPADPWPQAVGLLLAWGGSVAAGAVFHHVAEAPVVRWISRCRAAGWRLERPSMTGLGQRP